MRLRLVTLVMVSLMAAGLAACGARGKPEPPPGARAPDPDRAIPVDPLIRAPAPSATSGS
jgi:predicted small lipoprotein YifL